ncbi:hypothetical protein LTS18_006212 [Coniosporium uncinatum]|uniref:Uncharacterized protein n=1 Tax=Coniosporium uncinatum TaxID=93489 RepID=A0ACC3DDM0_9PEZI|nr:hypothetical protein LTS18_006212 [Coniosporium uncinatum]
MPSKPKLPWSSKSSRSQASASSSEQTPTPPPHLQGQDPRETAGYQYRQPEKQVQTQAHGQPAPAFVPSQQQPQQLGKPPVESVNAAYQPVDRPAEGRQPYIPGRAETTSQEKEKRGFRNRLGFGHSSKEGVDQSPPSGSKQALGRTVSLRKKESPVASKYQSSPTEEKQRFSSRGGSSSHLAVTDEEDEGSQIQPQQYAAQSRNPQGPTVPAKEVAITQAYQPHSQNQPQPQPYFAPPPSLARTNTGGSHYTQGGAEQYSSAEQHARQPRQHIPQSQQYPSDQPPAYQPSHPGPPPPQQQQYQAFHGQVTPPPQTTVSPPVQQLPPQSNENTARYSYYQQQPLEQQFPPPPGQPQVRHPQDTQQRPPSQQERYPPPPQQPHPELQHPQASRLPTQRQQPNHLNLQPPRPSSQQQQYAPPSPITPAIPPKEAFSPASQLQAQDPKDDTTVMPTTHGKTIRQVGDSRNPPARETSQVQGPPTYNSNVIPPGAQGQPFRGQSQALQQQDADMGRSTPSNDVSEDDAKDAYDRLQKEYRELREKYQKVKKYYFEKESQVHALQNTLAHQRLSQSRTSLDDSGYTTRFERLDGLVAQLAFSIRKDWRRIPEWLQMGVNRDALATGKQEMTVVGRAVICKWIVDEVFDKYFHPDLDTSLSMSLRSIQRDIRRLAPPFQSAEEEENLSSKVIAWRLATLEGLQDQFRGPLPAEHRQKLVAQLNEKLIAHLKSLLQDPAPPDVDGGVFMIVELAVGIALHVPMESRDVVIEYYHPGTIIVDEKMKTETGIPPLKEPMMVEMGMSDAPAAAVNAQQQQQQTDRASLKSTASDFKDNATTHSADSSSVDGTPNSAASTPLSGGGGSGTTKTSSRGILGGLMGTRKPPQGQPQGSGPPQTQNNASSVAVAKLGAGEAGGSQSSLATSTVAGNQKAPGSAGGTGGEDDVGGGGGTGGGVRRVRVAVGLGVQIRGKSVLNRAGVFVM